MGKRYGSDLVVDLLVDAGVEYVALNPGATFRGLHDSLVNGPGPLPTVITCLHEEIAVAMAHGYGKATGKPMVVCLHNVVGLLHASMAIYNAWCDRVPMIIIGGTGPMAKADRRPWIDWIHTALVQGNAIRDYVKWDDQPADVASIPESLARAWHTAVADPPGPVYVCLDIALQEQEIAPDHPADSPRAYVTPTAPGLSSGDAGWLAGVLASARMPVLLSDYAGATRAGFEGLREVAEALHAPVIDCGARFCFPNHHELEVTGLEREVLAEADVIVAFDVEDVAGRVGRYVLDEHGRRNDRPVTVVNVTPAHLKLRSWSQDYQQLVQVDRHLTATCESALPELARLLAERPPAPELVAARQARLAGRKDAVVAAWRASASVAEHTDTLAVSRLAHEMSRILDGRRWRIVSGRYGDWEKRLWPMAEFNHRLGWHGGAGIGYHTGAALGATLGSEPDVLNVCLQQDGDLLMTPSALWTAANQSLPTLFVMNNNRQYENTVGHAVLIAEARGRSTSTRHLGSGIGDPDVDFASLARSMGVWGIGPITTVDGLEPAVRAALAVVDSGRPALVDVVTRGS